jgi:hypothetical protein
LAQQTILIGDTGLVYDSKINGNFTELYALITSSNLTDVSLGTLSANDLLQWNGTNWVNRSLATAGIASKTTADTHYAKTVDETDTNICPPQTATGILLLSVELSPNSPLLLYPQDHN